MIQELIPFVSAIVTYVLGKISKKFNWNESLPIPVQNVMVGILVFLAVYVYNKVIGTEIVVQDIAQQIIYALGGSGIATLGYDVKKSQEGQK